MANGTYVYIGTFENFDQDSYFYYVQEYIEFPDCDYNTADSVKIVFNGGFEQILPRVHLEEDGLIFGDADDTGNLLENGDYSLIFFDGTPPSQMFFCASAQPRYMDVYIHIPSPSYINKVNYGGRTLIDLTADTVQPSTLLSGYTAHDASGAIITGTITSKTENDITIEGTKVNVQAGCYPAVNKNIPGVQLTVPESDTHTFYIDFPDVLAPASNDDWSRIIFSVDDEGNSDVTDSQMNLIAGEEVPF